MEIKTQDVYLPVNNSEIKTHTAAVTAFEGREESVAIEKHSNMVVLTKEQYEADKRKTAKDAFIAGRSFGIQLIRFANSEEPITKPDVTEYLTQLFGEGETGQK
jgi:hypothetical protein